MIYKKDAAFSYPILAITNNSYIDNDFKFDVDDLFDDQSNYIFKFSYDIQSEFINKLLRDRKISLVFIVQSADNFFQIIQPDTNEIKVSKKRLSLGSKTTLQLHLKSNEEISFATCNELNEFYSEFKDELVLKKNMILGFSNTVKYEGSENKPLTLIEKRIDRNQKSAFKIDLQSSTIVLSFKDEKFQMAGLPVKKNIMNMYIYQGLSSALNQFVRDNINEQDTVDIEALQGDQDNDLNQKLLDLMINKGISEINYENIDEVISKISNNIVEKYVTAVEEGVSVGD